MTDFDPQQVKDLTAALNSIAKAFGDLKAQFHGVTGATKGWENVLQEVSAEIDNLPAGIKSGKDLWNAMTKDAKVFSMVQKHINKNLEAQLKASGANAEFIKEMIRQKENAFKIAQRELAYAQKSNAELANTNELIKSWGKNLRDPAGGTDRLLGKMGELPQKLLKAREETGSLGGAFTKVGKEGMESMLGPAKNLFTRGGLLIGGVGLAVAALTGLFLLFKNFYEFLDKNVIPAIADFNKDIGGSGEAVGQLRAQMNNVGTEFEFLGMTFKEGSELVRDFSLGLGSVELDKDVLKTAKDLSAVVGLNAKQAGELTKQFMRQSGSVEGLKEAFTEAEKGAIAYGVPVRQVQKDMAESVDVLLRFGTRNALTFSEAAVQARSYGLSIKDVNKAFGEQMDSFENTSKAAANLNAIFGTNINSFELMLETDPTKRMEMLRKELIAQGKSWEKLSVFEQNVITQNLGVEKSEAALILSSEKERKKLLEKKKAQEEAANIQARWDKGIQQVQRTLLAWGKHLDNIMRSVTELVSAMFGFDKPSKEITSATQSIGKWMSSTAKTIRGWAKAWRENSDELGTFGKVFKAVWSIAGIALKGMVKLVGMAIDGWKMLFEVGVKAWRAFEEWSGIDIIQPLKDVWEFAKNSVDDFLKLLEEGINWSDVWGGMKVAAIEAIKGIASFFTNTLPGLVKDVAKLFDPTGGALGDFLSSGASWIKDKMSVDDAIITKGGKVIELNPQDNVFATKAPISSFMPAISPTANPASLASVASINPMSSRNQQSAPQVTLQPKIEVLRFEIDGKRIAEAQVRISRA